MPVNQPTKLELNPNLSQRITTSVSLERDLWNRLHSLAEKRRKAHGGRHSVSAVISELLSAHIKA